RRRRPAPGLSSSDAPPPAWGAARSRRGVARARSAARSRFSRDGPPHEEEAAEDDAGARDAEQRPSPRPLMEDADGDAGGVQAAGRDHETHAVQQRVRPRRQFGAVGVAMEDGEEADERGGNAGRRARPEIAPRAETESRGAGSGVRPWRRAGGAPTSLSRRPPAIPIGRAPGRSQIAGLPRCAPQSPTATIASRWSGREIGWRKPLRKPPVSPLPTWAKAPAGSRSSMSETRNPKREIRGELEVRESRASRFVLGSVTARSLAGGPCAARSRTRRVFRPCNPEAPPPSAASAPRARRTPARAPAPGR